MKRAALRTRKIPVTWSDQEYAALHGNFADNFDDRVSETLVDYEDEREVMDVVVQRSIRTLN